MKSSFIRTSITLAIIFGFPAATFAQVRASDLTASIDQMVQNLNEIENAVQTAGVAQSTQSVNVQSNDATGIEEKPITRALGRGANGDDVKVAQEVLAEVQGVYPEALATGYFGDKTERAVKRFQNAFNISETGVVGNLTRAKIAEITETPGRISVYAQGNEDALTQIVLKYGGSVIHTDERTGVLLAKIPRISRAAALEEMQSLPGVQFAERDILALSEWHTTPPNDPKYASQWHIPKIRANEAQDISTGSGVSIAVCDSGVEASHPDLATHLAVGWNTVDNNTDTTPVANHGTFVAGVIAAIANNGMGVAGVASGATIVPVRVTDLTSGSAYTSDLAECLTWAADHGIRIASMSFQVAGSFVVQSAADYMYKKNGVVVLSEGNTGANSNTVDVPSILSVAATDSSDNRTSWSTYGNNVDLAAPGSGIWTTAVSHGYASVSGTSFSAPIVAGVAALVIAKNPALTSAQVYSILKSTAVDLGTPGYDIYYGAGRVNALAAVQAASGPPPITDITPPSAPTGLVALNTTATSTTLSWTASTDNVGVAGYYVYRYNVRIATLPLTGGWMATTYASMALAPSTSYTYAVSAYDVAGNESAQSVPVAVTTLAASATPTTPPATPGNLTASNITSSSAVLAWTASTAVNPGVRMDVLGYYVYRNSVRIATTSLANLSATTYTDTNLAPTSTYIYTVSAYDTAGNESAKSAGVTVTTLSVLDTIPPTVPTGLASTTISSTRIGIKWTASTDNVGVAGYHILRNSVRVATTTVNSVSSSSPTAYTDVMVSPATSYAYSVSAYDAAGNESAQSASLVVMTLALPDTTPPTVSLSSSATSVTAAQSITLTATASDNVEVTKLEAYDNGVLKFSDMGMLAPTPKWTGSRAFYVSSADNGTHLLTLKAYDAAGNSATSNVVSVTVNIPIPDTTPPTVALTSPSSGAVYTTAQMVTISTTASDNVGVTKVEFYDKGVLRGTGTASPYRYTWYLSWNENGTHAWSAKAYDAAGNVAVTPQVSLSVSIPVPDTTPPSVPSGLISWNITSARVALSWTASTDKVGVAGYHILRNSVRIATTTVNPATASTAYTDTTVHSATAYIYTVSAFDVAGNESAKSSGITVTTLPPPDTTPPTVAFIFPSAGGTVSGTVNVLISATDNVAVGAVTLTVNGAFAGIKNTAPYAFTWDSTKVLNGLATLSAIVYDQAGNKTLAAISVTINNKVIDATLPTVNITSPLSGATVSGQVLVTVSAHDNVGVTTVVLSANNNFVGIAGGLAGQVCVSTCIFTWDSNKVLNGTVALLATAYDSSGNKGVATISITVKNPVLDTTPPSVPTRLILSRASSGSVTISWQPSTDNVGVKGYHVYRNSIRIATTTLTISTDNTASAVSPVYSYAYAVSAFDAAGNESAKSGGVSTPTSVVATPAPIVSITNMTVSPQYVGVPIMYRAKVTSTNGVRSMSLLRNMATANFSSTTRMIPAAYQPGVYELLVPSQSATTSLTYAIFGEDTTGVVMTSPIYTLTIANSPAGPLSASAGDIDLGPILDHFASALKYLREEVSALGK